MRKIYLDHSTVGLIYEIERGSLSGGLPDKKNSVEALKILLTIKSLEFYVSEDTSSEIKKKCNNEALQKIIDRFKFISLQHRIKYGEKYRYGHGVTFGGPYPEIKEKIKQFLEYRNNTVNKNEHEYDARELANSYKKIDYFVTIDYRTILAYQDDIKIQFGIRVVSPKQLLTLLN